jgi:hypothetical protein
MKGGLQMQLEELPYVKLHCDGAHRGLGDWYPGFEAEIRDALTTKSYWTTGWYSSKHEAASACISANGPTITVEVQVSDDLDTAGRSVSMFTPSLKLTIDEVIEGIRNTIHETWDQAELNQKENQVYIGFAIHDPKGNWVLTFIQPTGLGHELSEPPGDHYHRWGWQTGCDEEDIRIVIREPGDDDSLTLADLGLIQDWIESYSDHFDIHLDEGLEETTFTLPNGWSVRPWE